VLFVLTACYEIEGTAFTGETEPVYETFACQIAAQDTALQETISWQEAYTARLLYYAQIPISESDAAIAEWRFMLHDINQSGTPELFLAMYYDGRVYHRAAYGFVNGSVEQLKSDIDGEISGGLALPPNGVPGIIYVQPIGHLYLYTKFALYGTAFSRTSIGDVVEFLDSFRINAKPVTVEEFERIFGVRDEKVWLTTHTLTNESIRDIIFGW